MLNHSEEMGQKERADHEVDQKLIALLNKLGITCLEIQEAILQVGNHKLAVAKYFREKNMRELLELAKLLNPTPEDQEGLLFGKEYYLWREDQYVGIARWTKDESIGNSFQKDGEVFFADRWEEVSLN